MKKKILIGVMLLVFTIFIMNENAEAETLDIPDGQHYNLLFFKYNDKDIMLPIKKSNEKFDYTIGIDSDFDGKVDEEYKPEGKTKQSAKAQVLKSSNFNVYINDKKVDSPVKLFEGTDIHNNARNAKNAKSSATGISSEDLNSILILSIEGEVSPSRITSSASYGSFGWNLPVTINSYGQLESSSWLIPSPPTKSQKEFLDKNDYQKMTGDSYLSEALIVNWNKAFDPRRLEVYIPAYFLDSTLYDLPAVEGKTGSVLDTTTFQVTDGLGTLKDVEYINLSDIVYINPLCGHLGDVDVDQLETECSSKRIKDLVKFKWTLPPDIWIEEFSGRIYVNGDEQPGVEVDSADDKDAFDLIDKGAHDASDDLIRISNYGLNDAFPLNTEILTVLLSQKKLPAPIIVMDHNFGDFSDYSYDSPVRVNVPTLGDKDSGKSIGRGFNTKSKYIFQRVKLNYSEEKNIESESSTLTSCPTGTDTDCIFFFEATDENLDSTKEHYDDRFDMYASDFTIQDDEITETKEIKTCRDLESIGRGENYPGASHYEAWEFDQDYKLVNDINCYETTQKNSIYDDNVKDNKADGFEPLGYDLTGDGSVTPYNHTFDGNGHTISNLYMNHDYTNVGLFAELGTDATVKDLTFKNSSINISSSTQSSAYAGTVAGVNYGEVYNIEVASDRNSDVLVANDSSLTFTNGASYSQVATGGIVGYNFGGLISNSHVLGNVEGTNFAGSILSTNVGGIAGFNSGQVINTYVKGEVIGRDNVGGILGYNYSTITDSLVNGYLGNSYSMVNIKGYNNLGGIVGSNISNATIKNCYATSSFKRSTYQAVRGRDNVGGIVGVGGGIIENTYSAIPVRGADNVGGIAGSNKGDIKNSLAVGNVKGNRGSVGGIVGTNESVGTVYNNYSYAIQTITSGSNTSNVKIGTVIGDDKGSAGENKLANDSNLSDSGWYASETPGGGLSWVSSDVENEESKDWTAPVQSGDSTCLPWVYNDVNLNGDFLDNDGTYVPVQTEDCYKILHTPNDIKIENFKVNASTNDITLKYGPIDPAEENLSPEGSRDIDYDGISITKFGESTPLTCKPVVSVVEDPALIVAEDRLITFKGSDCNIEGGEKYSIDIEGGTAFGQEVIKENFNIVLQMPKESMDSKASEEIGDGVNQNTFVSSSTGFTDPSTINPGSLSGKFGIYELESIGYEEVFSSEANWGNNDLTLNKYDHVIRQLDDSYEVEADIDAEVTKTNTALDIDGGFENDGFRPIGYKSGMSNLVFTGNLIGDVVGSSTNTRVINKLYINLPTSNYVGLISSSINASNNISFNNAEITGKKYVGALAGISSGDSLYYNNISNSTIFANEGYTGGLIGEANSSLLNISNCVIDKVNISTSTTFSSPLPVGGLVGSTGVAEINNVQIKNNLTITGSAMLGGLVGMGGISSISNIEVDFINIVGKYSIGGLIGDNYSDNLDINDINIDGLLLKGESKIGGLIGDNEGDLLKASNVNLNSNIKIEGTDEYTGGLFGKLASDVQIKNSLVVGDVSGKDKVGGYIGGSDNIIGLEDTTYKGNVTGSNNSSGGSIGYSKVDSKLEGVETIGNVYGALSVGGLIGHTEGDIEITASKTRPSLVKTDEIIGTSYTGGMVGLGDGKTNINSGSNVYGPVTGGIYTGGLVGKADDFILDSDSNRNTGQLITGEDNTGGIAGAVSTCSIEPFETNNQVIGENHVGGLMGHSGGCTIDNIITTGSVNGSEEVGGIAGISSGEITNSKHTTGDVIGVGDEVGGIVGLTNGSAKLDNLEVTSKVSGKIYVGGIAGKTNETNISNSKHTTGEVTGEKSVGGIVGSSEGTLNNVESTSSVTGLDSIGGVVGSNKGDILNSKHTTGEVSGRSYVGGMIGSSSEGNLDTVEVTSEVNGTSDYVGGLIGKAMKSEISNSVNSNTVVGKNKTGGLVGELVEGNITNSKHITGEVSGEYYIGGAVGYHENGNLDIIEVNSKVSGKGDVGGFTGRLEKGNITNSKHTTGEVSGKGDNEGGAVGLHRDGNLENVEVTTKVTGTGDHVGGLIGYHDAGTITTSYQTEDVSGKAYVGGLVGYDDGSIIDSYSYGNTTGTSNYVGGLVGKSTVGDIKSSNVATADPSDYIIRNTGNVSGLNYVGGLVGYKESGTVEGTYTAGITVSGVSQVGGLIGKKNGGDIKSSLVKSDTVIGTNVDIGGLVGRNAGNISGDSSYGTVTDTKITGVTNTGGLIGASVGGTINKTSVIDNIDISAQTSVGGLIGNNDSYVNNSYSHAIIKDFIKSSGGLIGLNQGHVENSYAKGNVINTSPTNIQSSIGGLIGENIGGKVNNVYASGDVKGIYGSSTSIYSGQIGGLIGKNSGVVTNAYADGNVSGNLEIGGLIGRNDNANISNTYAYGTVQGYDAVGGILGYNKDAKLSNSISVNEVRLEDGIRAGGLIGFNDGDYTEFVENVYGYEGQEVYFEYSSEKIEKNNLVGNDLEYSSYASYDNVVKPEWYMDATNGVLNWNATNWDNSKVGVVDSISLDGYYPQINDTGGNLLLEQNVNSIIAPETPDPIPTLVENYKINSNTLDITIKLTDDETVAIEGSGTSKNGVNTAKALVSIYPGDDTTLSNPIFENIEENIVDSNILRLDQKDYGFEQDTTYIIEVSVDDRAGTENTTTFRVHTPKQVVMDYDLNGNDRIDTNEKDLTFSVIGDGSNGNNRTDVDNKFSSDIIEPTSPDLTGSSSVIESDKYGIYELESICSDEALLPNDVWDIASDTTLVKYDHVIRPCGGLYILNSNIDASETLNNTDTDLLGGFYNDGYNPIGSENFPFQGAIVGGDISTKNSVQRTIQNLYIYNYIKSEDYQGLVGYTQNSYFSNIALNNVAVSSKASYTGSLIGYGEEDVYITNCYANRGNVIGREGTGGLVGRIGKGSNVYNSTSSVLVEAGLANSSGDIESSSVDNGVGGLIGIFLGEDIEGSKYIGEYVHGNDNVGGLIGYADFNGTIKESEVYKANITWASSNSMIFGEGSNIGGFIGEVDGLSSGIVIMDSTSKADVIGHDPITGDKKGNENFGGFIGKMSGTVDSVTSYGTVDAKDLTNVGGLIGYASSGKVMNSHPEISFDGNTSSSIGGLIGKSKVYVSNCYSEIPIKNSGDYVGGLIGEGTGGSVNDSYTTTDIHGETSYVGGLAGKYSGQVSNSYAKGNVLSNGGDYVGGLIGQGGSVTDSYALGDVKSACGTLTSLGGTPCESGSKSTGRYIGGLAGESTGTITNSYALGDVKSEFAGDYVGGLVGQGVKIKDSYAKGNVVSLGNAYTTGTENYIGGLAGKSTGEVSNSYAEGNVESTDLIGNYIGGLIGESTGNVLESEASGDVLGNNYVGGLIGKSSSVSTIYNISAGIASGEVKGKNYIGGIVGSTNIPVIGNSSYEGNISGEEYVGGIAGESTSTSNSAFSDVVSTTTITGTGDYVGGVAGSAKGGFINSSSIGTLTGNNYIGGLVGQQLGDSNIINSYSQGEINGATNLGGLVGKIENSYLSINNSYSTSNINVNKDVIPTIESNLYAGGLVGNGQDVDGLDIYNTYSISNINVIVEPSVENVYVGGIIGSYNQIYKSGYNFEIQDNYYDGNINIAGSIPDNMYVGGIIGSLEQNINTTDKTSIEDNLNSGNITSSISASNISQVGRIIGNYYRDPAITDSYTYLNNYYYNNAIYTIASSIDFSGYLRDHSIKTKKEYEATLEDMKDEIWWSGSRTGTLIKGLGLESSATAFQSGLNFTAPWIEGTKYCMPYVLQDSDKNGISSGNDGSYVDGQSCYEVGVLRETKNNGDTSDENTSDENKVVKIENYKIDAMNLDIMVKLNISQLIDDNLQGKIKIYKGNHEKRYPLFSKAEIYYNMIKGESVVTIPGENIIEADQDYTIVFYDNKGIEQDNLIIHTPKQSKENYDINGDGVISGNEEGITFALIGDQVNVNTDVNNRFTTDKVVPKTGEKSDNIEIATDKYGIYELESIGYDETNTKNTSLYESDWSNSDLTLTKYNHIIRPLDGYYEIVQPTDGVAIDGSVTRSEEVSDSYGGWSTYIGNDNIDDGFNLIGVERVEDISKAYTEDFKGIIKSSKEKSIVSNIYIKDKQNENNILNSSNQNIRDIKFENINM